MTSQPIVSETGDLDVFTEIIHLGMMIFGERCFLSRNN